MKPETDEMLELSIVMPCLNEAETIDTCIHKARMFMKINKIVGEVVIGDNGSTDGSVEIAERLGARVVHVEEKGYGSALIGGITAAKGKFVIMGDSDDSHDLLHLLPFVEKLRAGYDFVVGNRFSGNTRNEDISYFHRSIGNRALTMVGRVFFTNKIRDFHCGLRGMTKAAFIKMDLRTTGMEFASEMIVKANYKGLKLTDVPTEIFPSGRSRAPHLRPIRDGWRHLRFLLLYSPRWLFLYPGLTLILAGLLVGLWLLPGTKYSLDVHTMLFASAAITMGMQSVSFAILTKTFAVHQGLLPEHPVLSKMLQFMTLEKGILIGGLMMILGIIGTLYALSLVGSGEFNNFGISSTMRLVIVSVTFLMIGSQLIFSAFFYSILALKTGKKKDTY